MDIGGTWIRIRTESSLDRIPTPSRLRNPQLHPEDLLQRLIESISQQVPLGGCAHISMGAAYDEETDVAYGSAPLWGPGRHNFRLVEILRNERPDVSWHIVNDVTAGLAHFVSLHAKPSDRYVTYLTISSGIALRTAYLPSRQIAVNGEGLQGEVGHLRASSSAALDIRSLVCDCGSSGHIAALSSGPGIPRVAEILRPNDSPLSLEDVKRICTSDRGNTKNLLAIIVEPIANLLKTLITLQPHIDLIGIGGGVPEGLGEPYAAELNAQLCAAGSYADNSHTLGPRLHFLAPDELRPEIGATLMVREFLSTTK